MSRNNKNSRNLAIAKACSKARVDGKPGASKTTPCHGKRWTYRGNPEIQKRIAEMNGAPSMPKKGARRSIENVGAAAL